MFTYLIKGVAAGLAIKLLDNYRRLMLQLVAIEGAKAYLHGVQMARQAALGLMRMGLMISLIGVGVLLIHGGMFVLLPMPLAAKAILAILLGVIYIIVGVIWLHRATNEQMWQKDTRVDAVLRQALSQIDKV